MRAVKQLNAHVQVSIQVLLQASPFFEKLLHIDLKESKEGCVRLEIITESIMADILEFIFTGSVHISNEDNA